MIGFCCCLLMQVNCSLDILVLVIIGVLFVMGIVLYEIGVVNVLVDLVIKISGGNLVLMLIVIYVCVLMLIEFIINNSVAILMLLVVLQVMEQMNLNQMFFILCIMMVVFVSFVILLGYYINLMVFGLGGYKFKDFLKVGVFMNILMGIIIVIMVIIFYFLSN